MSRNCYCRFCGQHTDCSADVCELCECAYQEVNLCADGQHCDKCIEEVKPNVYKYRREDGVYYLKFVPPAQ